MADIALQASATAARALRVVVKPGHNDQVTRPAAEAITAGAPIRQDTASGRWTNANGGSAPEALATHIAWKTVTAGESLTGIRSCIVDGFNLDALGFGAQVFLSNTDGRLADAAGTVSVVAGRVVPGFAELLNSGPSKLLEIGSFGA